jgi:hypothetical protein
MRPLGTGATVAVIWAATFSANASLPDAGTNAFEERFALDGGSLTFKVCDIPNCGGPSVLDRLTNLSPNLAVDEREKPEAPKVKPKMTKAGNRLALVVGQSKFITIACVPTRFVFGNNPWDLRSAGGDLILLEGYEAGSGVLRAWCEDGSRISYPVEVTPAPKAESK